MNYFLSALRNYAKFTGRARRSEYWYFVLFNVLISIATSIIDYVLGTGFDYESVTEYSSISIHVGYINIAVNLFMLIPGLAVFVRRLHDVGKSGWYILVGLIPLVGPIWLLILLFTDSQFGMNKYGPNPKGLGNTDEIDEIGTELHH